MGNRTNEPLTNVKVTVKPETPIPDDSTASGSYVGADGLRVVRGSSVYFEDGHFGYLNAGVAWTSGSRANQDYLFHWLVNNLPAAASVDRGTYPGANIFPGSLDVLRRDAVTIEHLASATGAALCRTERVFWPTAKSSELDSREIEPRYEIAGLSVDNSFPGAGETVNFKVAVDAREAFNVNAGVRHTAGLEFNGSPVITPAPKSPRTLPLAVWRNYDAAKGEGDFYIGSEKLNERTPTSGIYPNYEITLPLRLKAGMAADGQCVTATVTGIPGTGAPFVPGEPSLLHPITYTPYDDPSDNTATLCLGKPPASESPVLLTDGRADLLTLVGCASKTDYPCEATDPATPNRVEHVIGGGDAAANAGTPYEYFQPEDVIVHIPDPVGRNKPTGETGIFWWSGSDQEADHDQNNHPGLLPGVAAKLHFECLMDKDPNTSPDDDPEYKGIIITIADITDGQNNTIDHTPGAMIIGAVQQLNNRSETWLDVDGSHGNNRSVFTVPGFKICGLTFNAAFEFDQLGTYKADITQETNYQETGGSETAYEDTGRYTFHVGPVAELSVSDRGTVPALASGETAYTLDLTNHGPDVAESAKVAVELPSTATGVATVPSGLGTFHAAGTTGGVAHGPHWVWDAGKIVQSGVWRGAGRPQGRTVSLIVSGVTGDDTAATATVSNGNGYCSASSTTLPHIIREADCEKVTGATWTKANPYTVCIDTDHAGLLDVTPKPASESACEATTGNKWYAGTVLDHRQGNNRARLAARSGGGAGMSGESDSRPTIELDWPSASGAAEYRVFRSDTGSAGSYRQIGTVDKNTTDYTDETVSPGDTYYYQVEALYANRRLADIHATSVTATIRTRDSRSPVQVGNLRAEREDDDETTIDVTWTAPSNAMATTLYNVEYKLRGNSGWPSDWTRLATEQSGTSYTLTRASGASAYQFRVRAVNVVGESGWGSATVGPVPKPNLVNDLNAARANDDETTIDVSWTAPDNATSRTTYDVEYKEDSGDWTRLATNISETSYQLTGASGAKVYLFRVGAVTTLLTGEKLEGNWRNSNTVSKVPPPSQVTNLQAMRDTTDETVIDVSWTAPGNATGLTTYEVDYKQDGGAWTSAATGLTTTAYQLTAEAGGSAYQFQVRGVTTLSTNERLEGSWRSSNTVRGLPAGPIASVSAIRNTADKTTIDVSWGASARATAYDVEYRKNNGGWSRAASKHAGTSYTQTGAGGVESYTFRVRGVSDAGNGDWKESGVVGPPELEWQGYEVGPQVADGSHAWINLKMTSGPWWFDYRDHKADWSSCKKVAAGSQLIQNLRAPIMYVVDIFRAAGCDDDDRMRREKITTVDVPDQKLDGKDFNDHTHKRRYPAMGELGVKPADCLQIEQHSHAWPDGGAGQHWHCPKY